MKNRQFLSVAINVLLLFSTISLSAQPVTPVVTRPVISEQDVPVAAISPLASDNVRGEAFLRKPPGEGPFPAVVLIHGGVAGWETKMLRDYMVHTHASRFLAAGYVVVAMTRRDLDLSLAPEAVQDPVRDAIAVFDYLQALPFVDPESIVVRGTSVGGYLTLEVGAARDAAAILIEEPFSFPFVGVSLPFGDAQKVKIDKIERINSPVLLIRGDQTPNINDFNREVFIPALQQAGKTIEILTYPGELHSFAFYNNAERTRNPATALDAFQAMDNFFRENIRIQPVPLASSLVSYVTIERD